MIVEQNLKCYKKNAILSTFLFLYYYLSLSVCVLCLHTCILSVPMYVMPMEVRGGIRSFGPGITDSCSVWVLEIGPGSPGKVANALTSKPSL